MWIAVAQIIAFQSYYAYFLVEKNASDKKNAWL